MPAEVVRKKPYLLKSAPDHYITQDVCNEAIRVKSAGFGTLLLQDSRDVH